MNTASKTPVSLQNLHNLCITFGSSTLLNKGKVHTPFCRPFHGIPWGSEVEPTSALLPVFCSILGTENNGEDGHQRRLTDLTDYNGVRRVSDMVSVI